MNGPGPDLGRPLYLLFGCYQGKSDLEQAALNDLSCEHATT
jgi:hypothetical protein